MRKFFLITAVLLSATAAHAGLDSTVADAGARAPEKAPEAAQSSSAQHPDASAPAAQRDAMMRQQMAMKKQMMMQKQMAMQREMQRHPIRTRVHFAILKFKQKMRTAFR
ncbi:MAG: hypothetical protein JWP25_6610 [Bradyrhizobium sp.]|nr:hypothetical protein [Bradyrhizobium sp.]